jgi:hypothetical protein
MWSKEGGGRDLEEIEDVAEIFIRRHKLGVPVAQLALLLVDLQSARKTSRIDTLAAKRSACVQTRICSRARAGVARARACVCVLERGGILTRIFRGACSCGWSCNDMHVL